MYGHYYNEYFDEKLPFDTGLIDIYDDELTGKDLVKKLNSPSSTCDYCSQYIWKLDSKYVEEKEWSFYKSNEKPKESDWY